MVLVSVLANDITIGYNPAHLFLVLTLRICLKLSVSVVLFSFVYGFVRFCYIGFLCSWVLF